MEPSPFLLQLAILLLPGVIWAHLDGRYASKQKPSELEFLLRAGIFGLVSYAVTFGIFYALKWQFEIVDIAAAETKSVLNERIAFQVVAASCVGLGLSIFWMYAVNFKLMSKFLRLIRATGTYGDEDVWNFSLNAGDAAAEYVHLRDFANRVTYAGYVAVFSETDKLRELVLKDTLVYDFEGNLLFDSPRIYLARPSDGIHMEFPYRPETKQ